MARTNANDAATASGLLKYIGSSATTNANDKMQARAIRGSNNWGEWRTAPPAVVRADDEEAILVLLLA